jgi:hypothetical protein
MSLRTLVIVGVALAASAGWYAAARWALITGLRGVQRQAVQRSATVLENQQESVRARLRSECRLLSEDPRLKSTMATRGIDERTLADILEDLRKQTGSALLAVLTPEGKVQAVVGRGLLTGLDLSGSSVVRSASESADAAAGAWVVGDQVLVIGVAGLRFGTHLIGFLVVGAPLGDEVLTAAAAASGVPMAVIVSGKVVAATLREGPLQEVFGALALEPEPFESRLVEVGGTVYATRLSEVPGSLRSARVAFVRAESDEAERFELLSWLLWVPFALLTALGLWLAGRARPANG